MKRIIIRKQNDLAKLQLPAAVALSTLVVLAALAIVYYRERMLFTDAARILFNRINLGVLESSERRYGAYITESVPLLLAKLHVPLKIIIVAYSLSFNLFYLIVGAVLFFRCRQYVLVILLACYYTLFVSDAYFWTNSEIHQAVAYLFLCFGAIFSMASKSVGDHKIIPVFVVLSAVAIMTHPMLGFAFLFTGVFLALDSRQWPFSKKRTIVAGAIVVLLIAAKLLLSTAQSYDTMRMRGVLKADKNVLQTAFASKAVHTFAMQTIQNYWWSLLIFSAGIVMMIRGKKWLQVAWVLASAACLLGLVGLAFSSFPYLYYLEGEWQIMGIIIAVPFVCYLLPQLNRRFATALMIAIFATRIGYIIRSGHRFSYRVEYIEGMLQAMRSRSLMKVTLNAREGCPEGVLLQDWGLATESTLLSAMDGEYPQRTICAVWPNQPELAPVGNREMRWNFDKHPVSDLNAFYFRIDTTSPYVRTDYETLSGKDCGH